jgi:hypothetical protein
MTEPIDTPAFVYVKFEAANGQLQIAKHVRPLLLDPSDELGDFIRDIVHTYKADPDVTYLGLADEDEYEAFRKLH